MGRSQPPQWRVGLDGIQTSVKQISCLNLFSFGICDLFMLLELVDRLLVCNTTSSRYVQLGVKGEIKRSKLGAGLQSPCIPDTSCIDTGKVRYWSQCRINLIFALILYVAGF
jgi:hypothetical protein